MVSFLLIIYFLSVAFANDVVEWNDYNFDTEIVAHDIVLVNFFTPWCGHCKRLEPEFEKAAGVLRLNDPPVILAKVDCSEDGKQTCTKFGATSFPTMKIFKIGEMWNDYNGKKDARSIVRFIRSKIGSSSKEIKTEEELEKLWSNQEFSVVGFFERAGSDFKEFKKLADSRSSLFRFAHTFEKTLRDKHYQNDVVMYQPKHLRNKFEPSERFMVGEITLRNLKHWLTDDHHGLCGHRTPVNSEQFTLRPLVVAYYEVNYTKNAKGTSYWRNRVMKVASKVKKELFKDVNFAISNKVDFADELTQFGLGTDDNKTLITAINDDDEKFVMEANFSVDALEKFILNMLDGKIAPYVRSEPIPETNNETIKIVVNANFDALVNDDSKDVLLELYDPKSSDCKDFVKVYEDLAKALEEEGGELVLAKMDSIANDLPKPYTATSYPTLYFAPKKGKKKPKLYEGEKKLEALVKFLSKETTRPMKGYDRAGKKRKAKKAEPKHKDEL